MPSGVTQFRAPTAPTGADLAAALAQASSEAAAASGAVLWGLSLMVNASPKKAGVVQARDGIRAWGRSVQRRTGAWNKVQRHAGEPLCGAEFTSSVIIHSKYSARLTIGPMPALKPRALYEEVAEQLRQRIFRRELQPGHWIDELKITQKFSISRPPLREALKVLATEGLVTMTLRRGAYVTHVSQRTQ